MKWCVNLLGTVAFIALSTECIAIHSLELLAKSNKLNVSSKTRPIYLVSNWSVIIKGNASFAPSHHHSLSASVLLRYVPHNMALCNGVGGERGVAAGLYLYRVDVSLIIFNHEFLFHLFSLISVRYRWSLCFYPSFVFPRAVPNGLSTFSSVTSMFNPDC